jgi:hypothetical protein
MEIVMTVVDCVSSRAPSELGLLARLLVAASTSRRRYLATH